MFRASLSITLKKELLPFENVIKECLNYFNKECFQQLFTIDS